MVNDRADINEWRKSSNIISPGYDRVERSDFNYRFKMDQYSVVAREGQ